MVDYDSGDVKLMTVFSDHGALVCRMLIPVVALDYFTKYLEVNRNPPLQCMVDDFTSMVHHFAKQGVKVRLK